ncbi:MAG: hypothetical protein AAF483_26445, partial [Planctomycetota bacterium]
MNFISPVMILFVLFVPLSVVAQDFATVTARSSHEIKLNLDASLSPNSAEESGDQLLIQVNFDDNQNLGESVLGIGRKAKVFTATGNDGTDLLPLSKDYVQTKKGSFSSLFISQNSQLFFPPRLLYVGVAPKSLISIKELEGEVRIPMVKHSRVVSVDLVKGADSVDLGGGKKIRFVQFGDSKSMTGNQIVFKLET